MDKVTYRALALWLKQKLSNDWTEPMKTALQYRIGVEQDGEIGPITVKAFQRYLNRLP
jgi:lysozyme family protein